MIHREPYCRWSVEKRTCVLARSERVPRRHPAPIPQVEELAALVDDGELTRKLITAIERETKVLALEQGERETLLRALEDCPDDLAEFRGTLLRDLAWMRQEGLA
jgi:hypothetical protein